MDKIRYFNELVSKAKHIVISTHVFPDADGIGSEVALCLALRQMGKEAVCVNEVRLMERYKYLDPQDVIISARDYHKKHKTLDIDLFIVVDASNPARIGVKCQELLEHSKRFLFVDHHPAAPAVSALHCIDTTMAATGELVGKLIGSLKVKLTKEMALALYTSILIDTSSFRYPTVTGNTHRLLARLLDTGVYPPEAYNSIYGTRKIAHMQLLGRVLSTIQITRDEKIAWLVIPEKLMQEYGSHHEDTHGFINHLLILECIDVAVMFREQGKHVKTSLRSHGTIDVAQIAEALGGGGHNHSAATIFEGELSDVVDSTIKNIQLILKSM